MVLPNKISESKEEMIYEEENCSNVRTCTYRNNDADCLWKQERQ